jgi:hypothetical protein
MAGIILGACLLAFCTGVLALGAFGLHLASGVLRTLAFLVLVFGSQATIYAIRERRHLWGSRPSLLLAASSVADIAIASTLAIGGIAMAPLPPLVVTGTLVASIVFAFILDLVKVPVFAHLGIAQSPSIGAANPVISGAEKGKGTSVAKSSTDQPRSAAPKPPPAASTSEANAKPAAEAKAKTPSDSTPRIAQRAYELYEQGGRKDGTAAQNWEKAESEIFKDSTKAEVPGETNAGTKPVDKVEPRPETKVSPAPATATAPTTEMNVQPGTSDHTKMPSDMPPLVKRVHALYEELGRQDVQTAQEWEKAQGEQSQERSST